jgi:hypothetical protein
MARPENAKSDWSRGGRAYSRFMPNPLRFRLIFLSAASLLLLPIGARCDDVDQVVQSVNSNRDDVNDLISTILDVSPTARAKAAKISTKSRSKSPRRSRAGSTIPSLGIPESQLLEASSKFPKDFVGRYVYGRVSFKGISLEGRDACISFTSKGYRMFRFYTKDPNVIRAFSQFTWGTKFIIPKDCPLKILTKDLTFYVVRLPWDPDKTEHSFRELFRDFGNEMRQITEDTRQRIQQRLETPLNY